MIKLENLSFSYSKTSFINNLSSTIVDGRITAIIGPNGSGKSTLLRLCAGLLKPQSGSIYIDKQDIYRLKPRELAKQLAFLPQSRQIPRITLRSLVENGRFPYLGLSRRLSSRDERAVADALNVTGLTSLAERELHTLSGGERQKAYIALLVAQGAHNLLLDEPTTYLDINHRLELMELMHTLRDSGKCIVMVLHDIDLAAEYCDDIIVMNDGCILHTGAAADIAASGALQQAYSVEPIVNSGLRFRHI